MPRVAFYTFGLLRERWGHPQVRGFEERAGPILRRAREAPGFLDLVLLAEPDAQSVAPRFASGLDVPADFILSLWRDLASVFAFAYGGLHAEALRRRHEWFQKHAWPTHCAWWVEDGHVPTDAEAVERYEHLHDHGPTPFAFDLRTPFASNGSPVRLHGGEPATG